MNVLLVSQCTKRALVETRRILDQFAERKGDRTWQTPITMEGLDTLRRLLRKKARKNTAVACHWIRGKDHSELIWIVGDAKQFSAQGAVPTNTTTRDVLRSADEDDWHTGEEIRLLSGMAALMHDLGKACDAFQERLLSTPTNKNLYRHEWISLRLFQAFVGEDDDATWLSRLTTEPETGWLERIERDGLDRTPSKALETLPPLAKAIGWLILTHHRMPLRPAYDDSGQQKWLGREAEGFQARQLTSIPECIEPHWNEVFREVETKAIKPYWRFRHGLPVSLKSWQHSAARYAQRMLERPGMLDTDWLHSPYVIHLARLSLMLADHYYSSQSEASRRIRGEEGYPLFANTRSGGDLNQQLDEHILGVRKHSEAITRSLPTMTQFLPRLARHKGFRRRSKDPRFQWQDKAFDLAEGIRRRSNDQGFFGVNMASTGCGKTLANGRVMYALADPNQGARFTIALGLRTLTLQTGQAYRDLLQLGEDDLAIRVGGSANRELFELASAEAAATGSESSQSLTPESSYVHYEGHFEGHPVLRRTGHNPIIERLIAAPLLTCTIDHLIPATDSTRGGGQIGPMLRLMSGDLILDEPDDFDLNDLPALTRLVHWAGLLGSRVLLSSATLPPALIEGLFDAYRAGRAEFQRNRGRPGLPVNVCCAWFDEHDRRHRDCDTRETFQQAHSEFAHRRYQRLEKAAVRRRGELLPITPQSRDEDSLNHAFAERCIEAALELHENHSSNDPQTNKQVSFGLIRMANIKPLVGVARALFEQPIPEDYRIHLCVYHSQHPLLIRSSIERQLDQTLDRRDPDAVFGLRDIRQRLDGSGEANHLFIVLGSPVTEVGRDHDYDWAIVEPSSVRSLIQLAGRVRRHRPGPCQTANIRVFETNLKHLKNPADPAFCRPGFEEGERWRLNSHQLADLMRDSELQTIDSRPRILEPDDMTPNDKLVDLEHERLRALMVVNTATEADPRSSDAQGSRKRRPRRRQKTPKLGAYTWWHMPQGHLSGVLPQHQRFRKDDSQQDELVLMPDESEEDYQLMRVYREGRQREESTNSVESLNHRLPDDALQGARIQPWGETDYMEALSRLADELGMELNACAERFGRVTVPQSTQGWTYHPALGFTKTD